MRNDLALGVGQPHIHSSMSQIFFHGWSKGVQKKELADLRTAGNRPQKVSQIKVNTSCNIPFRGILTVTTKQAILVGRSSPPTYILVCSNDGRVPQSVPYVLFPKNPERALTKPKARNG